LRLEHDDSIKLTIVKNRQLFQWLQASSALREASCGFYAASFAVSGWFLGRAGAVAESRPRWRHPIAI